MLNTDLYLALVHHPVVNKKGSTIASALTTIDMHDIARAALTFGARGFFVVTPLEDQKHLAAEVMAHWIQGVGGKLNPHRKQALELIRVVDSFEDALECVTTENGKPVITAATTAAQMEGSIGTAALAGELTGDKACLIAFGTAWGLSPEFMSRCDYILEPVKGVAGYNHLSVRSAVSIILDRLVSGK